MLLYTSSWATALPENFKRIGISIGQPRRDKGGYKMYRTLAPGPWFKTATVHEYRQLYMEILGKLDPQKVLDDIIRLADGLTPALLCFEPPTPTKEWCHRGYVSTWLEQTHGLHVLEYGQKGWGWSHPKIPEEYRQPVEKLLL